MNGLACRFTGCDRLRQLTLFPAIVGFLGCPGGPWAGACSSWRDRFAGDAVEGASPGPRAEWGPDIVWVCWCSASAPTSRGQPHSHPRLEHVAVRPAGSCDKFLDYISPRFGGAGGVDRPSLSCSWRHSGIRRALESVDEIGTPSRGSPAGRGVAGMLACMSPRPAQGIRRRREPVVSHGWRPSSLVSFRAQLREH